MNIKQSFFTGLALGALCVAASGQLKADNISNQPDPTKHHHYANPDGKSVFADPDNVMHGHYNYTYSQYTYGQGSPGNVAYGQVIASVNSPPEAALPVDTGMPPAPVNRASHLIGMKVRNPNNDTLGTIQDVIFDLPTGRVSYVVLRKAGHTHGTGENLAIPLSSFTPSADRQSLILNADKNRVQNSTGFEGQNLPGLANPAFGAQPAPAPTPTQREIYIIPLPSADPNQDPDLDLPKSVHPDLDHGQKEL